MAPINISVDEFNDLFVHGFEHEAVHLETRDSYGTSVELPYMAMWEAGEHDDLAWLGDWCTTLREHAAAGRRVRRARIVSEPLSTYQRWSHSIAHPMVDAGEDIRWVPRTLVSTIAIPGNDYYLFDDRLVVFLHYEGSGLSKEMTAYEDPTVIDLCRHAFEAVWEHAIPHREYQPV